MPTLFDEVNGRITAKDAAERYGLQFDRRHKKAICIWHNDKHPSLHFFKNGSCWCFACSHGGDAIDITERLFGLSPFDAVKQLNADFNLGLSVEAAQRKELSRQIKEQQKQREAEQKQRESNNREWIEQCDRQHNVEKVLFKAKDWGEPGFMEELKMWVSADEKLNILQEEMR